MAKNKTRAGQARPAPITSQLPEQALLRARAQRLQAAVSAQRFPLGVNTRFGEVQFASIVTKTDTAGLDYAEVYTAGSTVNNDPHWRIWNPPLLVEDPFGDIVIDGKTFREDPIQAIAEAIARHGGRRKTGGTA